MKVADLLRESLDSVSRAQLSKLKAGDKITGYFITRKKPKVKSLTLAHPAREKPVTATQQMWEWIVEESNSSIEIPLDGNPYSGQFVVTKIESAVSEAVKYDKDAAKRTDFDEKAGRLSGSVKDWLDAMGIEPADIKAAVAEIKGTALFKSMSDHGLEYTGTPKTEKNGLLRFERPSKGRSLSGGNLEISANGQIRGTDWSNTSRGPLKSAKPRLVHGDPVKSLIKIYTAALEKLIVIEKKGIGQRKTW